MVLYRKCSFPMDSFNMVHFKDKEEASLVVFPRLINLSGFDGHSKYLALSLSLLLSWNQLLTILFRTPAILKSTIKNQSTQQFRVRKIWKFNLTFYTNAIPPVSIYITRKCTFLYFFIFFLLHYVLAASNGYEAIWVSGLKVDLPFFS